MTRRPTEQAGLLGALFAGTFLLFTGATVFALMNQLSGVLPRFLDGLVLIFVIPVGVPVLLGKAVAPLERRVLGAPVDGESPMFLMATIWGATFWIPALLYSVLLLQDVDLLRNGVLPLDSWKPGVAGWIQVTSPPAWEQRGEITWSSTSSHTRTTCPAVAVAVPAGPGAGPERVWYCSVQHCINGPVAEHLRQVASTIQKLPAGGLVLRDAATRSHCERAAERSVRGVDRARERLFLTPGPAPEELIRQTWRRLGLFFGVVALLWVIFPAVLASAGPRRPGTSGA
ncbi:MAG: hypothetical protein MUF64_02005 [Polyangiaceae bacterium]|jgi:hypothetical protein|nr:hypothetical protein [Polyangiaceae bacterium]